MSRHLTREPGRPSRIWATAAGVFVVGALIGTAWGDQRTLWLDESASVISATRSWAGLVELVRHIDVVHALYYAILHLWFDVVGYSPTSLRALSAIAVAGAAALMVPLGARFGGLRLGVIAAGVLLTTPATLLAATNGRSQALEILAAVAASLLLLTAVDNAGARPSWRPVAAWAGYGVVSYVGVLLDLWIVFLVAAHACTLLLVWLMRGRPGRRMVLGGAVTIVAIGAASAPFAILAAGQSGQIGWLTAPTLSSAVLTIVRDASFSIPLVHQSALWPAVTAGISWLFAIVGVVHLMRRHRVGLALILPWFLVPPLGLLVVTFLISPTFTDRYLAITVPALALLVAAGLNTLVRRYWAVVAVAGMVALLVLGAYAWKQVRFGLPVTPDFGAVADEIHDERSADPTDTAGIIFGNMQRPPTQLQVDYPDDLRGVRDLERTPDAPADGFWPERGDVGQAVSRSGSVDVVWYVGSPGSPEIPLVTQAILGQGFTPVETNEFRGATLIEYRKAGS